MAATDLVPEVNREPGIRMALVFFAGVGGFLLLRLLLPAMCAATCESSKIQPNSGPRFPALAIEENRKNGARIICGRARVSCLCDYFRNLC